MKCPVCGKFLSDVYAITTIPDEEIVGVKGICKTHGKVDPYEWVYEDFFSDQQFHERDPKDNPPHPSKKGMDRFYRR